MRPLLLSVLLAGAFAAGLSPSDIAALRQPGTPCRRRLFRTLRAGRFRCVVPTGRLRCSWSLELVRSCRENMPALVQLARTTSARFVGIDELESANAAKALVAEYKVPFPTVLLSATAFDAPGVTDEQRGATGIDIPAVYFIDAGGRSYKAIVGADAVRSWLRSPHPLE